MLLKGCDLVQLKCYLGNSFLQSTQPSSARFVFLTLAVLSHSHPQSGSPDRSTERHVEPGPWEKNKEHMWMRSMWVKKSTSMSKHYQASVHTPNLPFSSRLLMQCRNHACGNTESKPMSTVLLQALHPPWGLSKGRIRSQEQQYMLHMLPSQLRYYWSHVIDSLSWVCDTKWNWRLCPLLIPCSPFVNNTSFHAFHYFILQGL